MVSELFLHVKKNEGTTSFSYVGCTKIKLFTHNMLHYQTAHKSIAIFDLN